MYPSAIPDLQIMICHCCRYVSVLATYKISHFGFQCSLLMPIKVKVKENVHVIAMILLYIAEKSHLGKSSIYLYDMVPYIN
jgi:hypothetical protein